MKREADVRRATLILKNDRPAGHFESPEAGRYRFTYLTSYTEEPVSLTMPVSQRI